MLYYRYGGLKLNARLRPDGRSAAVLVAPDGREVEDVRGPSFRLPDWVQDPFPAAESAPAAGALNGRYTVEKALQFSSAGGVYVALDSKTGRRVILKEARANVHNFSDSSDAADMLRHEYALLERIAELGAAPRPIELFHEWEHLFLAEEYFEGYMPLRRYSSQSSIFLDTRPTKKSVAAQLEKVLRVTGRLAEIVEALHESGVLWGDISFNNVLVHPETLDVKIIDLESARLLGDAPSPRITTPGFADVRKPADAAASVEDDYFGVGAVLLFLLTHVNGLLGLKPEAWKEALAGLGDDFGVPPSVSAAVASLLDPEPRCRPRPSVALARGARPLEEIGPINFAERDWTRDGSQRLAETVRESCRFIKANADLHRKDRIFPADPLVYETNPMSLAHGAAGVLYALDKVEGRVDARLLERLASEEVQAQSCPPSLYHGLSGIAWALLELGCPERARQWLEAGVGHPLLGASAGLYHGLAGWGMANLRFWLASREPRYLEHAERAAEALLASARERDGSLFWPAEDGIVRYGLAHGQSGIALFLLYLDRALGGGRYGRAAARAFEHDLAHASETENGALSWRRADDGRKVVYPYWKHGSAGIGIVALRFYRALREPRYRELIERIYIDCDRKYSIFPGRNEGLAGIGEFLLDAHRETGERKFLNSAFRAAAGLAIFRVSQPEGAAFPGDGVARFSCDLATGSAGIVLFLDRLLRPRPAHLLLDELLA